MFPRLRTFIHKPLYHPIFAKIARFAQRLRALRNMQESNFVVDLTKIDMATEEDKTYNIDYWARLFKARTWEDLKMIAEKDENLCEASESLFILNADDITRQKCRAREEQRLRQEKMERKINTLTEKNEALSQEIETLKKLLEENNISYK